MPKTKQQGISRLKWLFLAAQGMVTRGQENTWESPGITSADIWDTMQQTELHFAKIEVRVDDYPSNDKNTGDGQYGRTLSNGLQLVKAYGTDDDYNSLTWQIGGLQDPYGAGLNYGQGYISYSTSDTSHQSQIEYKLVATHRVKSIMELVNGSDDILTTPLNNYYLGGFPTQKIVYEATEELDEFFEAGPAQIYQSHLSLEGCGSLYFECDFFNYNRVDYFYELRFFSTGETQTQLKQEMAVFNFQVTILAEEQYITDPNQNINLRIAKFSNSYAQSLSHQGGFDPTGQSHLGTLTSSPRGGSVNIYDQLYVEWRSYDDIRFGKPFKLQSYLNVTDHAEQIGQMNKAARDLAIDQVGTKPLYFYPNYPQEFDADQDPKYLDGLWVMPVVDLDTYIYSSDTSYQQALMTFKVNTTCAEIRHWYPSNGQSLLTQHFYTDDSTLWPQINLRDWVKAYDISAAATDHCPDLSFTIVGFRLGTTLYTDIPAYAEPFALLSQAFTIETIDAEPKLVFYPTMQMPDADNAEIEIVVEARQAHQDKRFRPIQPSTFYIRATFENRCRFAENDDIGIIEGGGSVTYMQAPTPQIEVRAKYGDVPGILDLNDYLDVVNLSRVDENDACAEPIAYSILMYYKNVEGDPRDATATTLDEFSVDSPLTDFENIAYPIRWIDATTLEINPENALGEVGTFSFYVWARLFHPVAAFDSAHAQPYHLNSWETLVSELHITIEPEAITPVDPVDPVDPDDTDDTVTDDPDDTDEDDSSKRDDDDDSSETETVVDLFDEVYALLADSLEDIITLEPSGVTEIALDDVTEKLGEAGDYQMFTMLMTVDPVEYTSLLHLNFEESLLEIRPPPTDASTFKVTLTLTDFKNADTIVVTLVPSSITVVVIPDEDKDGDGGQQDDGSDGDDIDNVDDIEDDIHGYTIAVERGSYEDFDLSYFFRSEKYTLLSVDLLGLQTVSTFDQLTMIWVVNPPADFPLGSYPVAINLQQISNYQFKTMFVIVQILENPDEHTQEESDKSTEDDNKSTPDTGGHTNHTDTDTHEHGDGDGNAGQEDDQQPTQDDKLQVTKITDVLPKVTESTVYTNLKSQEERDTLAGNLQDLKDKVVQNDDHSHLQEIIKWIPPDATADVAQGYVQLQIQLHNVANEDIIGEIEEESSTPEMVNDSVNEQAEFELLFDVNLTGLVYLEELPYEVNTNGTVSELLYEDVKDSISQEQDATTSTVAERRYLQSETESSETEEATGEESFALDHYLKFELFRGDMFSAATSELKFKVILQSVEGMALAFKLQFENPELVTLGAMPDMIRATIIDEDFFTNADYPSKISVGTSFDLRLPKFLNEDLLVKYEVVDKVVNTSFESLGLVQVLVTVFSAVSLKQLWNLLNVFQVVVLLRQYTAWPARVDLVLQYLNQAIYLDDINTWLWEKSMTKFESVSNKTKDAFLLDSNIEHNSVLQSLGIIALLFVSIVIIKGLYYLCKICARKCKCCKSLTKYAKEKLFYSVWLRWIIVSYLKTATSLFPFFLTELANSESTTRYMLIPLGLGMLLLIVWPLLMARFLLKNQEQLEDPVFRRKWHSLYDGIRLDSFSSLLYVSVFSVRRFDLVLVGVYFSQDSYLSGFDETNYSLKILSFLLIQVIYLSYIHHVMPHDETLFNRLEYFNEYLLGMLGYTMLIFHGSYKLTLTEIDYISYVVLFAIAMIAAVNIFIMIKLSLHKSLSKFKRSSHIKKLKLARRKTLSMSAKDSKTTLESKKTVLDQIPECDEEEDESIETISVLKDSDKPPSAPAIAVDQVEQSQSKRPAMHTKLIAYQNRGIQMQPIRKKFVQQKSLALAKVRVPTPEEKRREVRANIALAQKAHIVTPEKPKDENIDLEVTMKKERESQLAAIGESGLPNLLTLQEEKILRVTAAQIWIELEGADEDEQPTPVEIEPETFKKFMEIEKAQIEQTKN